MTLDSIKKKLEAARKEETRKADEHKEAERKAAEAKNERHRAAEEANRNEREEMEKMLLEIRKHQTETADRAREAVKKALLSALPTIRECAEEETEAIRLKHEIEKKLNRVYFNEVGAGQSFYRAFASIEDTVSNIERYGTGLEVKELQRAVLGILQG